MLYRRKECRILIYKDENEADSGPLFMMNYVHFEKEKEIILGAEVLV